MNFGKQKDYPTFTPMKKLLVISLLISHFSPLSFSQPVFNSCNLHPAFGDSLIGTAQRYDTTGVSSGTAGANIIWDYSLLTFTNSYPIGHYYSDAANAHGFSLLYSSSNLADSSESDGYIYYFNYGTDSISYFGKFNDTTEYYHAWNPELEMTCPLNFGNSFSDDYTWHNMGTVCMLYHTYITRSVTYDSYGTLVLFKATYPNCARLKIIENTLDTMFCAPNIIPEVKYDSTYLWIDMNTSEPVMKWHYFHDYTNNIEQKTVEVYPYDHIPAFTVTGIEEALNENEISIYPNPAQGKIQVSTTKHQVSGLEIYNVMGEKIISSPDSAADVSSQPSGIYFIQINTSGGRLYKKIILSH